MQIGMKLPPGLVDEVDKVRNAMQFPPERTAVIEVAIREWLDRYYAENKRGDAKR